MLRRIPLLLSVTFIFTAACAHNPARQITLNDEEVQVHEEKPVEEVQDGDNEHPQAALKAAVFTRGAETLDEQEFYESIGDTATVEKVVASRNTGITLQRVGVGLAIAGFLMAGAGLGSYFLSDTDKFGERPPIPVPDSAREYTLYGGIAAGIVGALGVALTLAMGPKVRGDNLLFDLAFARSRMEVARYGENGASPADVKTLTFGEGDDGKLLCGAGELQLAPLVARDAKGRIMKVTDRADWFNWSTTPRADLISHVPDAPVLTSPVGTSFADVDAPVAVKIGLMTGGVEHAMTFQQTFACDTGLSNAGSAGSRGQSGQSGSSGKSGGFGSSGSDGSDGSNGGDGKNLTAEIAWVKSAKRSHLALIVADGHARLFDPSKSAATVSAAGGSGGSGGRGGSGGSGGRGEQQKCQMGGNGGTGGRGGRGGLGGRGGHVEVRAADAALLAAVHAQAPGGEAGNGGSAGSGGSSGGGSACPKGSSQIYAKDGARGADGSEGTEGSSGAQGTVDTKVMSPNDMRQIAKVLAANPELSLETNSANVAVQARHGGKRHR